MRTLLFRIGILACLFVCAYIEYRCLNESGNATKLIAENYIPPNQVYPVFDLDSSLRWNAVLIEKNFLVLQKIEDGNKKLNYMVLLNIFGYLSILIASISLPSTFRKEPPCVDLIPNRQNNLRYSINGEHSKKELKAFKFKKISRWFVEKKIYPVHMVILAFLLGNLYLLDSKTTTSTEAMHCSLRIYSNPSPILSVAKYESSKKWTSLLLAENSKWTTLLLSQRNKARTVILFHLSGYIIILLFPVKEREVTKNQAA